MVEYKDKILNTSDSGAGTSEEPLREAPPQSTVREDVPMDIHEEDNQVYEQQGVQAQDVLPNIAVPMVRRRARGRGKSHAFLL